VKLELEVKVIEYIKENPDATDQEVADNFKDDNLNRAKVWRVRSRFRERTILDTTLLNEDEKKLYSEFKLQKKIARTKEKRFWIFPIKRTIMDGPSNEWADPNLLEATEHHNRFLNNYVPQMNVQALDVKLDDKRKILEQVPFTAKTTKSGTVIFPKFFINPLQALDYIVLQDIYMHTICGSIIDLLVSFTMGRGIRPVLKLNDEDKVEIKKAGKQQGKDGKEVDEEREKDETKDEAIARVLDESKDLLEPLIAIDDSFADALGEDPLMDEDFNSKIESLIRNHWIYGRDIMTYEYFEDRVFKWKDKAYPDIPNVLKVPHPRDIGFVQVDQPTLKLKGVQLMFGGAMIESSDMLYLEHMQNSAIYNAKFYGYSKMQRMIGHGRSLRKLVDRDFPNISSIGYSGFAVIAFKKDEKGSQKEEDQNRTFVNNMTVGIPNATALEDPEKDMHVHNVDTNPKIKEMIEMAHYHAEAAAKSAEVPTTLISKEKDPNRDTLLGILRIFLENVITRHRIVIGKKFTAQWYMKNFRIIYKNKPKTLEQFHVEAEFDDFKLESWADLVSSVVELSKLQPLKAQAMGELLGIQNFENMIDPEGDKLVEQSLTDGEGNKLTMTKDPKGKGAEAGPKPNEE